MWFGVTDQSVFAVAGFWRQVGDQRYFAMVTCDANTLVAPIHPKAMIAILQPDDHDRWLTGSYDDVLALQRPYPANRMTVRGQYFQRVGSKPLPEQPPMSDREVWEKALIIAAQFGDDGADQFATRLFYILRDTADPQDWRRIAAAVDVIASGSKQ